MYILTHVFKGRGSVMKTTLLPPIKKREPVSFYIGTWGWFFVWNKTEVGWG